MNTRETITNFKIHIPRQPSPLLTGKIELAGLRMKVFIQLFKIVLLKTGNIFTAIKSIYRIKRKFESIFGERFLSKAAEVDGRYFWRLAAPGFPSKASWDMQSHEVNRFFPDQGRKGLRSLLFSITNRCSLNCEHCFEWDNLNREEKLSVDELISIVHKYQDFGTTQIMLSGGEPMLRINDILKLLKAAKEGTDFWIITSGIGLTIDRAKKLKESGLTGVMVSLDHFDPQEHNRFRGYDKAYRSAIDAVVHANQCGLVTTLSLCATRSFVTQQNLIKYMELAKDLGASFVQVLEPRAVGRYKGEDVSLSEEQLQLIEEIYLEYNSSPMFADYPLIHYLGHHQRTVGCFGAGDRFFYIDTEGDAHICPYCTRKIGSAQQLSAEEMIDLLGQRKCHAFHRNTFL